MTGSEAPEISVVLAYGGSPSALRRCVSAIQDPSVRSEVIVVCRDEQLDVLSAELSDVVFATSPSTDVGRQRALGIGASSAPLLAITRDDAQPASGWLRHFIDAHHADDLAAIGGPVIVSTSAGAAALAEYLSEYSRFSSKVASDHATDLAATNVCYRRDALPLEDIARDGYQEIFLHDRLLREGKRLRYDPAVPVRLPQGERITSFIQKRFRLSRRFAQRRSAGATVGRRLIWTFGSPLLPSLFLMRTASRAVRNGQAPQLLRAFPLVALFHTAAGFAEAVGYAESFLPGKERK